MQDIALHNLNDMLFVSLNNWFYYLIDISGSNWVALDGTDEVKQQYFINVCHDVLQASGAENCHPNSAVCLTGDHSHQTGWSAGFSRFLLATSHNNTKWPISFKHVLRYCRS